MPDMQSKLGRELLKSLVTLREQKGDLSIQDVGGMFLQMASSFSQSPSPVDQFMHEEIGRLARYITDAKGEIFSISTNEKSEAIITDASAHLDEVIKSTEEATTIIMDAADHIQAAAAGIDAAKEKEIMDATARIYDACTFQDITGQRINKVIKLLGTIEERVGKLNALFGTPTSVRSEPANSNGSKTAGIPPEEKNMLNGPQLAGQGASQAEVDALLANLGVKK